jgi:predicted O-methyltransferase YrrM
LRRVRGVIERLVRDGTAVVRSDGTLHSIFPVAVYAAEGEARREWVLREGATRTIEIGLGYGISALFICEGLLGNADPVARHVALDPYQATRFADCGLQFLEEAGIAQMVEHHAEESQIALPRFLGEARRFHLAFVDGNHRFNGVFLDLVYLGRLVRAGGIVLVDDYQLPAVARGVVLCDESGLDARGSLGRGRSPPVGRPPYFHGPRHATVRLLRRLLKPEPPHATCSGLRPDHSGWEMRVGAFAMCRAPGENAQAHGRGRHHQGRVAGGPGDLREVPPGRRSCRLRFSGP